MTGFVVQGHICDCVLYIFSYINKNVSFACSIILRLVYVVVSRSPLTPSLFLNREQKSRRQGAPAEWLGRLWHHRVWELRVWTQAPLSHERAHGDHRRPPQRAFSKALHPRSARSQKRPEEHRGRLRASEQQTVLPAAAEPCVTGQQTPHLVSGPDRHRVLLVYASVSAIALRLLTCQRPGETAGLTCHDAQKLGGRSFSRPLV